MTDHPGFGEVLRGHRRAWGTRHREQGGGHPGGRRVRHRRQEIGHRRRADRLRRHRTGV